MDIDRERASLIGLTPKNVVDNVITALTSNGVIAPSYWIDPETGNNYMLTVQYSNAQIGHMNMEELGNIPFAARTAKATLRCGPWFLPNRSTPHGGRSLSVAAR